MSQSIDELKAQLAALDAELAQPDPAEGERALRNELDLKSELLALRKIGAANDALQARGGWERPSGFTFGNGPRTSAIWYRQLKADELKAIGDASMKGPAEAERAQRAAVRDCILWTYPEIGKVDDGARAVEEWISSRLTAYPMLWDELLSAIRAHTAAAREVLRGKV